jgi:two-component system OmpR family sensor kinase
MARFSLRLRLLLLLAPLFVLGAVAADVSTYTSLQSYLVSQLDNQIFSIHDSVARALVTGFGPQGGGSPLAFPRGTYALVLNSSGTQLTEPLDVLFPTDSVNTKPVLPSSAQLPTAEAPRKYFSAPGTGSVREYRVYLDAADFRNGDVLLVALPQDEVDATLSHLLLLEVGVTGAVTIAIVIATWLIVRRSLRPLERMADTARSIGSGDLGTRVQPADDATEVGRLGLALNTMLQQLELAFAERQRNEQRLRHFISDASHELRTPLTSVQGYAELIQRAPEMDRDDLLLAMRRMEEETQRMGVLVDDLLLLARLDQGRPLQRDAVDLEALVSDACADARVMDPARAITARIAAPLAVTGDDMRLRQVLGNLLRNATVHTPPRTPVEVALSGEGQNAVIDVVDHGHGVPEDQRERIFERFHRADPETSGDRGGSGLGLSIVAAVVAAHGGGVRVLDTPGGGATFRVTLPLREVSPIVAPVPDPAGLGEPSAERRARAAQAWQ